MTRTKMQMVKISSFFRLFPSPHVTGFIVKCGHDVHARNNLQETPLHIACKVENFHTEVVNTLLDHGAHLDVPDSRNICPIDILKSHRQFASARVSSLKCLATRSIVKEEVPFLPEDVPYNLNDYVKFHTKPARIEPILAYNSDDDVL